MEATPVRRRALYSWLSHKGLRKQREIPIVSRRFTAAERLTSVSCHWWLEKPSRPGYLQISTCTLEASPKQTCKNWPHLSVTWYDIWCWTDFLAGMLATICELFFGNQDCRMWWVQYLPWKMWRCNNKLISGPRSLQSMCAPSKTTQGASNLHASTRDFDCIKIIWILSMF